MWHITITTSDPFTEIRSMFMANQDKIDRLAAQLTKAKAEIVAEIARLKDQIDNGTGELDFTALDGLVADLDGLNPDVPSGEPGEEEPGTGEPA
ncbi:hypothetical protein NONI108955_01205 [Nocardia ninae]|uniref:Uncharacterized protein n=2 Tax=Nocardia ninae TaxID=356145 RepID=A0A511MED6_9NOCA|nr:hypothetical protein NN4_27150 [Nocardia ninae NBRC 108245]